MARLTFSDGIRKLFSFVVMCTASAVNRACPERSYRPAAHLTCKATHRPAIVGDEVLFSVALVRLFVAKITHCWLKIHIAERGLPGTNYI